MTDTNRGQEDRSVDDLRTRIAAVLAVEYCANAQPCDTCRQSVNDLADAVIRELGLPPHWGRPSFDNGDTCELTDSDPAHRPTESAQ